MNIDVLEIEEYKKNNLVFEKKHFDLDLKIYNYSSVCQYKNFWTELLLSCRGLVINSENKVVARPFQKFFNYEEVIDKIPKNSTFEVFEKLDGSLGIIFKYKNEIIIATRGSFDSEQVKKAYRIIKKYPEFLHSIKEGLTYLVEIIYPENRIIVDYKNEEKLVLLSIIETETGKEIPYDSLTVFAKDLPIVKKYDDIKDFNKLKELNWDNSEGFVVRFENGFRMKIKFNNYIRLHKLLSNMNENKILEHLKNNDNIEKIIENTPDEFFNYVNNTISNFKEKFNKIEKEIEEIFEKIKHKDEKEYALEVISNYKTYKAILFNKKKNRDYSDLIWKLIENNI